MISQQIQKYRKEKGLTQKELADLLLVTPQAVSRWEKGDVEPSIDTIKDMSRIFGITIDELLNDGVDNDKNEKGIDEKSVNEIAKKVAEETASQTVKEIQDNPPKQVLTICACCKKPIYESEDIVSEEYYSGRTKSSRFICRKCDNMKKEEARKAQIEHSASQRKKSYIWSAVFAVAILIICVIIASSNKDKGYLIAVAIVLPILTFAFSSCIFLNNNFIGDTFMAIASWGFVKFPGIIFSFDLDGLAFLIVIKILFAILGFLIGLGAVLLALVICMPLSLFVYPFALKKSIKHPELTELC